MLKRICACFFSLLLTASLCFAQEATSDAPNQTASGIVQHKAGTKKKKKSATKKQKTHKKKKTQNNHTLQQESTQ